MYVALILGKSRLLRLTARDKSCIRQTLCKANLKGIDLLNINLELSISTNYINDIKFDWFLIPVDSYWNKSLGTIFSSVERSGHPSEYYVLFIFWEVILSIIYAERYKWLTLAYFNSIKLEGLYNVTLHLWLLKLCGCVMVTGVFADQYSIMVLLNYKHWWKLSDSFSLLFLFLFFTGISTDLGWLCCVTCIVIEITNPIKMWRRNMEGVDS